MEGQPAEVPTARVRRQPRNAKLLLLGAALGLLYGMILRAGSQWHMPGWTPVMSISFLLLVPFAVGFITVFVVERRQPQPVWIWLLLPWVPVLGGSLGAMLTLWEGFICVIMFAPIAMICQQPRRTDWRRPRPPAQIHGRRKTCVSPW